VYKDCERKTPELSFEKSILRWDRESAKNATPISSFRLFLKYRSEKYPIPGINKVKIKLGRAISCPASTALLSNLTLTSKFN
jgi:hypothetical protein